MGPTSQGFVGNSSGLARTSLGREPEPAAGAPTEDSSPPLDAAGIMAATGPAAVAADISPPPTAAGVAATVPAAVAADISAAFASAACDAAAVPASASASAA